MNICELSSHRDQYLVLAGKPMLWFGKYAITVGMHVPLGVAGAMLPYCCRSKFGCRRAHAQLHGWTVGMGAVAALMTFAGLGTGFVLALWAGACAVLLLLPQAKVGQPSMHKLVLLCGCPQTLEWNCWEMSEVGGRCAALVWGRLGHGVQKNVMSQRTSRSHPLSLLRMQKRPERLYGRVRFGNGDFLTSNLAVKSDSGCELSMLV